MRTGRPKKYEPKYHIRWVRSLARRGLTVKEIADELGVAKSTLCKWCNEDEELSDALNEGRSYADSFVEDGLYKRAVGMKVVEKRTIVATDKNGESKPVRAEILEKELPPDVTAIIYWLKNRNPEMWRDVRDVVLREETKEVVDEVNGIIQDVMNEEKGSGNKADDE